MYACMHACLAGQLRTRLQIAIYNLTLTLTIHCSSFAVHHHRLSPLTSHPHPRPRPRPHPHPHPRPHSRPRLYPRPHPGDAERDSELAIYARISLHKSGELVFPADLVVSVQLARYHLPLRLTTCYLPGAHLPCIHAPRTTYHYWQGLSMRYLSPTPIRGWG